MSMLEAHIPMAGHLPNVEGNATGIEAVHTIVGRQDVIDNEKRSSSDEKFDEKLSDTQPEYHVTTEDVKILDIVSGEPLPENAHSFPESVAEQITVRAVFVGLALGALCAASNVYLGLKTGFTFSGNFFGAIVGFLIIKPLAKHVPQQLPVWFGINEFGPKENCVIQSVATSASSLGSLWVAGLPAAYQLGLLPPIQDAFGKIIGFALAASIFGAAIAVPLRKLFVLRQAKNMPFPNSIAASVTIRALHDGKAGRDDAKRMGKWLGWSFLIACIQQVAATWAPGPLQAWHIFYWIAEWGGSSAIVVDNWGWYISWQPAFIGSGMLAGLNASCSFYFGSFLAWAIIGPSLVATGRAVGVSLVDPTNDPNLDYISYYSTKCKDPTGTGCSPRYNLLWPGVLVMLVSAFTEIGMSWRAILNATFWPAYDYSRNYFRTRKGLDEKHHISTDELQDIALPHEQIPWWMWVGWLCIGIIVNTVVLSQAFDIDAGFGILGLVLSFIFAFIGIIATAQTTINPLTACSKATQLVIGGASHGMYPQDFNPATGYNNRLLSTNLFSGMVAGAAADMSTDMIGDFKTGHLLRAAPIAQFAAQMFGGVCASVVGGAMFLLFSKASPCIFDPNALVCPYSVPAAAAWRAVAIAVTSTNGLPVPVTSGIIAIVLAVAAFLIIVVRENFVPARYRVYVLNPGAMALAFVLPQTFYGLNMVTGAVITWVWVRYNAKFYDQVGIALAAGMIAGQGIAGVIQAIIIVAGGAPATAVSNAGCPPVTGC